MKTSRRQINWEVAKQRVARVQSEIAGSLHVDSAQLTNVLRQRAERLAQRGSSESVQAKRTPVLTFRAANERFGLELDYVAQVYPRVSITPVPEATCDLLGVANLQGNVRSIIDLARSMGLASSGADRGCIVLMRVSEALVGLYVESLEEICLLELEKLSTIERTSPDRLNGLIKGTTDDCITVLNPEGLISHIRQARPLAVTRQV